MTSSTAGDAPARPDSGLTKAELLELLETERARVGELRRELDDQRAGQADTPDGRLVAALSRAQGAFPPIPKNHTAEVRGKDGKPGYSYSYADLSDVLTAVRPVLAANSLAITQRTVREDRGTVLVTELRHAGGGVVVSEVDLGQSPNNPQAFGGALTYLRRYELATLLGIAPEEDRDAQDVEPSGAPAAAPLPTWARPVGDRAIAAFRDALAELVGEAAAAELAASLANSTGGDLPQVAHRLVLGIVHRMRAQATERAEAAAARDQQDTAAEQPDPPAPDDVDNTPAPPDDAASDADAPEPGSIAVDELPADPAVATGVLRAAGCTCPEPPIPGYRAIASATVNDACPIIGHGIPF